MPDRREDEEVEKIIGYQFVRRPAALELPREKWAHLYESWGFLVRQKVIDTETVHSILAYWIWGAVLCRDLLAAPQSIFSMIEKHPKTVMPWWPSARREAASIRDLLLALRCELALPVAPVIFATDAMGSGKSDLDDMGAIGRSWALLGAPGRSWGAPGRSWALLGAPGGSWPDEGWLGLARAG